MQADCRDTGRMLQARHLLARAGGERNDGVHIADEQEAAILRQQLVAKQPTACAGGGGDLWWGWGWAWGWACGRGCRTLTMATARMGAPLKTIVCSYAASAQAAVAAAEGAATAAAVRCLGLGCRGSLGGVKAVLALATTLPRPGGGRRPVFFPHQTGATDFPDNG